MPLIKYSQKVNITFSMTPFEFIMHVVWTHLVIFTIAKNGQNGGTWGVYHFTC